MNTEKKVITPNLAMALICPRRGRGKGAEGQRGRGAGCGEQGGETEIGREEAGGQGAGSRGEKRRWGDGEMGRKDILILFPPAPCPLPPCPLPPAPCPLPPAPCPLPPAPCPLPLHQVGSVNKLIVNVSFPGGMGVIQARMMSPSSNSTVQA